METGAPHHHHVANAAGPGGRSSQLSDETSRLIHRLDASFKNPRAQKQSPANRGEVRQELKQLLNNLDDVGKNFLE